MFVKWGMVGAGNVTQVKAGAAWAQEDSESVAVARRDATKAAESAQRLGAKRFYTSLDALLADPEINAVYIATPHYLHREQAIAAAEAGKHVLCEKPMGMTVKECREVIAAAKHNGVQLAIPYYRRFYPIVEKMKEIIGSGVLGDVVSLHIINESLYIPDRNALSSRDLWRTQRATAGGGALNEYGSHRLDLIGYLLGDAVEVVAFVDTLHGWYDVEDQATVVIKLACGAHAQADVSWCKALNTDYLDVCGTEGRVVAEHLEKPELTLQIGKEVQRIQVEARALVTHRPVVRNFVRGLNELEPIRCTGEDGLKAAAIVEAAYLAAQRRSAVKLAELG